MAEALTLTHRPVEAVDIPLVCAFPQSAEELFFLFPWARYPLTPAQLENAIAQRADSTVVELDGQVAGFANFYRWDQGGSCAIGNVIVAPCFRGQGVGRYLIESMIGLAFSKHEAAEVTISCFNRNLAGLLLYSRLGFQPHAIEERRDWNGEPVALIHMRLPREAAEGATPP